MKLLNFPIGTSDFEKIRLSDAEYVDKTQWIAEILQDKKEVLLFPRPRRFGKTLNLSMLKYFFDLRRDSKHLFKNLMIEKLPEFAHVNRYPVIHLTLKDVKADTYESAITKIGMVIAKVYTEHAYLLESTILDVDAREYFAAVKGVRATKEQLETSLYDLSDWLHAYHQTKTVILMDEYDSPVHAAYTEGYYEQLIGFMRSFMGSAFKDNSHLFKGVITGILRVSKEGMFSGLNNIDVYSLLSDKYAQYFGFTQEEVDVLLEKTGQPDNRQMIRDWYNGFKFGTCEIYNPWSLINYFSKGGEPNVYWVNTSSNDLVKDILAEGAGSLKSEFEALMRGESISQLIDEFVTLPELRNQANMAFSLLVFSGYLKIMSKERIGTRYRCQICIPNREIQELFEGLFSAFFNTKTYSMDQYSALLTSLVTGDIVLFEELLQDYLLATFSYYDVTEKEPERFYHGFVLGLLVSLQNTHWVKSNKESGYGRYDVLIIPKDQTQYPLGTMIEFKVVRKPEGLDQGIEIAFQQIEDQKYRVELEALGISKIQTLAIVFCGKQMKLAVK